ncbi:MAG: hypothetical protein A3D24_00545 [Candidatus Blackburnbacteria bacterium RIFCSPHIGHO2_02_FULL_39_13]|uniref:PrgI family protein n=1 Tax=Candidatus Blackburnbacteria bacterium RIFCSPLOWO2_01_FULL_40_20 TaxID=1797519 RepID=A0A1G1VFW5_9BACT|nr:MAG: hypothetical protein UT38_C0003G0026 [Microgenomates group bacterium GW2011_GWA2_39_19]OGY08647.1 MAG: hypothetical protein A3D24_00545 [Candidatus Blackburnbacteria bacterium RIFCSPHIGHO2_02_FULL_39_13]OGY14281.1 MAG: hypothetical protein A3A77_02290 [Candidatus Blackburnbacteria bacterium RIFCSPLOWO2_01_FULL_40_20]OGY14608.1 MAG: hypothetical protein A3I52_00500 [Candidatus Blackburnbacteria bacterium RIFCSPLOWO2_02_FULL_40_10]HBL52195.1 hypothetical protein [Candidatus Blackburnbacte
MQQHPVPQHISNYEFKLVGDMTLKQFFQLAGGILVALIFYATPLPGIIKWPLVVLFSLIGAMLAFLPIRERPLSVWFLAFIRAIYAPTIYVYKEKGAEEVFRENGQSPEIEIVTPMGAQRAEEYLHQIPKTSVEEKFDKSEESLLARVSSFFHANSPSQSSSPFPTQTISAPQVAPVKAPQEDRDREESGNAQISAPAPRQVPVYVQVVDEESSPIPTYTPHSISAPRVQNINVERPTIASQQQDAQTTESTPTASFQDVESITQPSHEAVDATFTPEAAPPLPPDRPNTIVGQVTTHEGKIVDSAIMEIRDSSGKPVRAVRTNRVGHFITVTPLANGDYEIETEKDQLKFDVIKFRADGNIIPSILIRAKE